MPKAIRDPVRLYTCAWCGQRKPLPEMRHPGSDKGKAPSTCAACRAAHPDQSWCDFHGCAHPAENFKTYWGGRPGYFNVCQDTRALRAARVRDKDHRTCQSCEKAQESWFFRGGRNKSPTCRDCEARHPRDRWCVGCADWRPESYFNRTGRDGKFWTVRCKPCRSAHNHGTTVAEILRIQGTVRPQCASCGSTATLEVHHDHECCWSELSSGCCIRGYLCHECNSAEGLLKTAARARALARYMGRAERAKQSRPPERPGALRPSTGAMRAAHPVQTGLW